MCYIPGSRMSSVLRRIGFLGIVVVLLSCLSPRGSARQQADLSSLDPVIAEEMAQAGVPGVALAIVSQDKVVYLKGFGLANAETREPVTPDTLFQVGSVTKMFTAAAALDAAREGKVKLDG